MKENSIEEDILNIEKYVELVIDKNYCDCNELNVICAGNHRDGSKNVAYSIQHILSDYERILKENKKKDKQIEQYQNMLATNDMLHVIECENKDKIIDFMTEQLTTPIHDKEWIKKYYENKAKEVE